MGKLVLSIMLLCALMLTACGGKTADDAAQNKTAKQLAAADVIVVRHGELARQIAFTGTLTPLNETVVSAESGGTLARLLVNEGERVKAGQIIAEMDNQSVRESLAGQRAQVDNSAANLALAQTKLKQQQVLFDKGFVSKLALEQAQNEYRVALGSHKTQQTELAKLQKNQADSKVKAPLGGVVFEKIAHAGELVSAGGALVKIAQTDVLEIAADLSSEQITFVEVGQEARFKVANDAPEQTGRIVRINPVADAATRQFTVFIHVQNQNGTLKAGQFAQGQIVLEVMPDALAVAQSALRGEVGKQFVYVVQNGKITKRPVKPLLQDALNGQVALEGLHEGDAVLRGEVLGIAEGDAVALPEQTK